MDVYSYASPGHIPQNVYEDIDSGIVEIYAEGIPASKAASAEVGAVHHRDSNETGLPPHDKEYEYITTGIDETTEQPSSASSLPSAGGVERVHDEHSERTTTFPDVHDGYSAPPSDHLANQNVGIYCKGVYTYIYN